MPINDQFDVKKGLRTKQTPIKFYVRMQRVAKLIVAVISTKTMVGDYFLAGRQFRGIIQHGALAYKWLSFLSIW